MIGVGVGGSRLRIGYGLYELGDHVGMSAISPGRDCGREEITPADVFFARKLEKSGAVQGKSQSCATRFLHLMESFRDRFWWRGGSFRPCPVHCVPQPHQLHESKAEAKTSE